MLEVTIIVKVIIRPFLALLSVWIVSGSCYLLELHSQSVNSSLRQLVQVGSNCLTHYFAEQLIKNFAFSLQP